MEKSESEVTTHCIFGLKIINGRDKVKKLARQ